MSTRRHCSLLFAGACHPKPHARRKNCNLSEKRSDGKVTVSQRRDMDEVLYAALYSRVAGQGRLGSGYGLATHFVGGCRRDHMRIVWGTTEALLEVVEWDSRIL